jgi:hypothetical protein
MGIESGFTQGVVIRDWWSQKGERAMGGWLKPNCEKAHEWASKRAWSAAGPVLKDGPTPLRGKARERACEYDERLNWHRLFGLLLTDFFADSPFEVELEKDLSAKKQILDVVPLRKRPGRFARRLPDGFDELAPHNLLTFKSYREPLDDWALKELTGHYVNYRKQVSPSLQSLLPEEAFRL